MLIYFLKGALPWQGLQANNRKNKYDMIAEKKASIPVATLCKGLPSEFETYMNYVRTLMFEDQPDYLYLRKLFKNLMNRKGFCYDYEFDWTVRKNSLASGQAGPPPQTPRIRQRNTPLATPQTRQRDREREERMMERERYLLDNNENVTPNINAVKDSYLISDPTSGSKNERINSIRDRYISARPGPESSGRTPTKTEELEACSPHMMRRAELVSPANTPYSRHRNY